MALTSWKTYAAGDNMTAADRNTYERDNGRWLSHHATGGAPMARVYNTTAHTGISTGFAITYDTARFNLGTMWVVGSASRLTVPTGGGGKYMIGANARIAALYDGSGSAELTLSLRVNGTTTIANTGIVQEAATSRVTRLNIVTLYHLAAADYVEAVVDFTNMTSVDVSFSANYSPEMFACWVAE